jgi:DNA-binding MarR family transcriptional regulator
MDNYFRVPNQVYELGLPGHQREVLIYLYRCSNNKSDAFPSYDDMRVKLGMTRMTAIRAIKRLENRGLIEVMRSNRKVNHYRILV